MLVATSGGCTDTAYAVIVVENDLVLEIPNVFTPNGDNVNDAFTIKAIAVKSMEVMVYNRWGEKMYNYSGDKPAWDGTSAQGGKAPAGTYFYMLKATGFNDKTVERQGTVTLFR
jgi:gliding motility-associated-like protein